MEVKVIMEINGLESPIEMELKDRENIEDCPEGAVIIINDYVGRFAGVRDDGVRMKSITRKITMGFDLDAFDQYWQEINH
ncbi:hypothetical protein CAPN002_00150 [Capnocytophaga stomatis]|uniref:hypothetical protein n=1 Tax=Capnocytophaga stomatis TaxID=1848904 RepID=UPI00194EED31|nr:hypothetical protein [Capnocytophaga stomatis]GIJ92797.1 hypothetical protein CAPN002_00150 [Capnocytophaga stomatis]